MGSTLTQTVLMQTSIRDEIPLEQCATVLLQGHELWIKGHKEEMAAAAEREIARCAVTQISTS